MPFKEMKVASNKERTYCELCKMPMLRHKLRDHLIKCHPERYSDIGDHKHGPCYENYFENHSYLKYLETEDCFHDDNLFPLTPEMDWWIESSNKLTFANENDSEAVRYIRTCAIAPLIGFVELHLTQSMFRKFVLYLESVHLEAFLLPFSCYCTADEVYRHVICAARNLDEFMANWDESIMYASKRIHDWIDLRRTIESLSTSNQCSFYEEKKHFDFMHPVTKSLPWCAALSVQNGVAQLLNEIHGSFIYENQVTIFREYPLIRIEDLDLNVKIEFGNRWLCVRNEETDAYVHLFHDEKLHFKMLDDPIEDEDWRQYQDLLSQYIEELISKNVWLFPDNPPATVLALEHQITALKSCMLAWKSNMHTLTFENDILKLLARR